MNPKYTTNNPHAVPTVVDIDASGIERMGVTMLAMVKGRLSELHDDLNMTSAEISAIHEWMKHVTGTATDAEERFPPFQWHSMFPVKHAPTEASERSFVMFDAGTPTRGKASDPIQQTT